MKKLILVLAVICLTSTSTIVLGQSQKRITDRYGHTQGFYKTDKQGNTTFSDRYGHTQGKITNKGVIIDRYGHTKGKIQK